MLQKYNNDLNSIVPQDALEILLAGNQRFINGISVNKDLLSKVEITGNSQKPFAAILSCMDSRAPVELLFDQGIGDVFSVRMAGNVTSENVLGSLEYATGVVGSKLLMVMGHTNCGAIKGAIDKVELGNLTQLLDKIQPAVEQACESGKNCDSSDKEYVNAVSEQNVRNVKQAILDQSPIIRDLVKEGKVLLVGAMYDVETGSVAVLEPNFTV